MKRIARGLITLLVPALVACSVAQAASPPSSRQLTEFRYDLGRYIDEMKILVLEAGSLQEARMGDRVAATYEPLERAARMLEEEVGESQLAEAYRAFERYPSAWNLPSQMRGQLRLAERNRLFTGINGRKAEQSTCADGVGQSSTCDSCPSNAPQTNGSSVSTWFIAEGVTVVAEAIYEPIADAISIPIPFVGGDVEVPSPIKIVLGIVFFVAKGVALGFETAVNVSVRCEDFNVRQVERTNLDETISSRASADAVQALQDAIEAFAVESERLEIEDNMARKTGRSAVAFFQLPVNAEINPGFIDDTSLACAVFPTGTGKDTVIQCTTNADCTALPGATEGRCEKLSAIRGRLQKVRLIVKETIDRLVLASQDIGPAVRFLDRGDQQQGAERWVEAYESYRKAYRQALILRQTDKG